MGEIVEGGGGTNMGRDEGGIVQRLCGKIVKGWTKEENTKYLYELCRVYTYYNLTSMARLYAFTISPTTVKRDE